MCYNGSMSAKKLKIIGNSSKITVSGISDIPAKTDTGAEFSSIWASNITLTDNNELEFCLFAPESPLYTGEIITVPVEDYLAIMVRNSTGQEHIRYRAKLPAIIRGKRMRAYFTLADRSRNNFPVLIGRRTLRGRFLVDPSKLGVPYPPREADMGLNAELKADPQAFHQKYISKAGAAQ